MIEDLSAVKLILSVVSKLCSGQLIGRVVTFITYLRTLEELGKQGGRKEKKVM